MGTYWDGVLLNVVGCTILGELGLEKAVVVVVECVWWAVLECEVVVECGDSVLLGWVSWEWYDFGVKCAVFDCHEHRLGGNECEVDGP